MKKYFHPELRVQFYKLGVDTVLTELIDWAGKHEHEKELPDYINTLVENLEKTLEEYRNRYDRL